MISTNKLYERWMKIICIFVSLSLRVFIRAKMNNINFYLMKSFNNVRDDDEIFIKIKNRIVSRRFDLFLVTCTVWSVSIFIIIFSKISLHYIFQVLLIKNLCRV